MKTVTDAGTGSETRGMLTLSKLGKVIQISKATQTPEREHVTENENNEWIDLNDGMYGKENFILLLY